MAQLVVLEQLAAGQTEHNLAYSHQYTPYMIRQQAHSR